MASDEAVVVATIAFGMGIGEDPGHFPESVLTVLPRQGEYTSGII
jgi:hypothetical protein